MFWFCFSDMLLSPSTFTPFVRWENFGLHSPVLCKDNCEVWEKPGALLDDKKYRVFQEAEPSAAQGLLTSVKMTDVAKAQPVTPTRSPLPLLSAGVQIPLLQKLHLEPQH